jgi:hypothetical protein
MSDAEEPEAPPSPSAPLPARPRITPLFTPDRITAAFTVVLALATLALVVTAYFQHIDSVEAIEATKRLAVATETAANDSRKTASAQLLLKLDDVVQGSRVNKIITDIESHGSSYPLIARTKKGRTGRSTDADVEEYIGIFEDLGYFIQDNLIIPKMAYDHFSYDIEKAWCNADVQRTIREARADDKSTTAQTDPIYGNFEKLAKEYLAKEGQSCKDLENQ